MKLRLIWLLLVAAALVASHPSLAAAGSTAPAACAANSSSAPAALPGFTTPASQSLLKTIIGPTCGTCSLSPCVGARLGSICGIGGGGQYKYCGDIGICLQDGLTQCQCKTGPPF